MALTPSFLRRSMRARLIAAFLGVATVMVMLGVVNVVQSSALHAEGESLSSPDVTPLADLRKLTDDFEAYSVHGLVAAAAAIDLNIGVAAQGSRDIAAGAGAVADAAETSAERIEESRGIAEDLVGMASGLQVRVAQFTV